MAAAVVMEFCASVTSNPPKIQPITTTVALQWDELDVETRLELIARAWVLKAPAFSSVCALDIVGFPGFPRVVATPKLWNVGELIIAPRAMESNFFFNTLSLHTDEYHSC